MVNTLSQLLDYAALLARSAVSVERQRAVHVAVRHEHGGAGSFGHRRADAAGESEPHAEHGEGDPAVHGGVPFSGYSPLEQGAGFLNTLGAVRLAKFYVTARYGSQAPSSSKWSRAIYWGNHRLDGRHHDAHLERLEVLACSGARSRRRVATESRGAPTTATTTSSGARRNDADNIVWGTSFDDDNIVWGTACGNGDCGDNIVWGTSIDDDNIIWGTSIDNDNIVWGTDDGSDNIIWGTSGDDNIIWGTAGDDNIVWGTSLGDNIVWGTATCSTTSSGARPTTTTSSGARTTATTSFGARRVGGLSLVVDPKQAWRTPGS